MLITVYHYPRCGTCRKALAWLDSHGIAYEGQDLVAQPPSAATLRELWRRSGLPIRRWFNTSGQSYRQGGFKDRLGAMTEDDALDALAADGKLIKRPVVDAGPVVLVGFDAEAFARALQ